jgi:hypothetical protein
VAVRFRPWRTLCHLVSLLAPRLIALNATRVKWNLRANEKRPAAVVPGGPREGEIDATH